MCTKQIAREGWGRLGLAGAAINAAWPGSVSSTAGEGTSPEQELIVHLNSGCKRQEPRRGRYDEAR